MLACVSTTDQIANHPANASTTKQLFSFPKGQRFLHYKKVLNHELQYSLRSEFRRSNSHLKTTFGAPRTELFPQKEQS